MDIETMLPNIQRMSQEKKLDLAFSPLAVIGLGYVGLPLALLAEKRGFRVIGFDVDEKKIELLKKG